MSRQITIKVSLGDAYNTIESNEVKINLPDTMNDHDTYMQVLARARSIEADTRGMVDAIKLTVA
jgi:hypothetical protein